MSKPHTACTTMLSYRDHLLASASGLVALDLKILIFLHFARTVASLESGAWPSLAAAQRVSSMAPETPSPTPLLYRLCGAREREKDTWSVSGSALRGRIESHRRVLRNSGIGWHGRGGVSLAAVVVVKLKLDGIRHGLMDGPSPAGMRVLALAWQQFPRHCTCCRLHGPLQEPLAPRLIVSSRRGPRHVRRRSPRQVKHSLPPLCPLSAPWR